jgi:uncharacterized protein YndB with AHSA1/START domain
MADIFQDFPIKARASRVFEAVSSAAGMDAWWTKESSGEPHVGSEYKLGFGPKFDWRAKVTECVKDSAFELEITQADADWIGTRVGFHLEDRAGITNVRFHHTGWPSQNEHWRISCYCWPMYLRIMRRYLEHGEVVPFEERLDV